jgi:hypothetical protein
VTVLQGSKVRPKRTPIQPIFVPQLLTALCDGILRPKDAPRGDRVPICDAAVGAVMRIYRGSAADTDIRIAIKHRHLPRAWSDTAFSRFLNDPMSAAILTRLIEESAAPFAQIENRSGRFAVGWTPFVFMTHDLEAALMYGQHARPPWEKLHVMIGVETGIVTAANVSPKGAVVLPDLLATTARRFAVKDVSAGRAYLSTINVEAIAKLGAIPWIPFKQSSVGLSTKSLPWREMWGRFFFEPEDFLRRGRIAKSKFQATIRSIKVLGSCRRSKSPVARANEVLAFVLLHNLTRTLHAIEKFGLEVDFASPRAATP